MGERVKLTRGYWMHENPCLVTCNHFSTCPLLCSPLQKTTLAPYPFLNHPCRKLAPFTFLSLQCGIAKRPGRRALNLSGVQVWVNIKKGTIVH